MRLFLSQLPEKVRQLFTRVDVIESKIGLVTDDGEGESITGIIDGINTNVAALQLSQDKQDKKIEDTLSIVTDMGEELRLSDSTINERVDVITQSVTSIHDAIDTLDTILETHNEKILVGISQDVKISQQLQALFDKVEIIQRDLEEVKKNMSDQTTNLEPVMARISVLEEEVPSLKRSVEELSDRIAALCSISPMATRVSTQVFEVGVKTEYSIKTYANKEKGTMVLAHFTLPDEITEIEYYEDRVGTFLPLTSPFGPPVTGFPILDMTARFRATVSTPGKYTIQIDYRETASGREDIISTVKVEVEAIEKVEAAI
ncbi:hypothetical protein ACK8P5_25600 (plasmid) [Paenibacillus sp. EC2-1]|uniref:hypothetical protein n=1 Tax=Paenibacillus sp. EC2-1 TaxID=3388665 RepID=UPI003BEEF2E0